MSDNLTKKAESKPSTPEAATPKKQRFAVAASPFNGIKLELAIVLVLVILVCGVGSRFTQSGFELFLLAFACTSVGALWVVVRTRMLLQKLKLTHQASEGDHLNG